MQKAEIAKCKCESCRVLEDLGMLDLVIELLKMRVRQFRGRVEVVLTPEKPPDILHLHEAVRLGVKLENL